MKLSFDEIASQFDQQRGLPRKALVAWVKLVDELANGRHLQIVEPGIGTGRVTLPLAAMGHHVTGTDISPQMLQQCERSARERDLSERVLLLESDATAMPFADHHFDMGVIAQLLYLVPDWPTILDELARVVRPGGVVIHLTEPTTESNALSTWSTTWREMIEATGYRHTALSPTGEEVEEEFLRRWPDLDIRPLATWSFGQTVSEAMNNYAGRVRPLYPNVPAEQFTHTVNRFLDWAQQTYPDGETPLDGIVTLTALIALT